MRLLLAFALAFAAAGCGQTGSLYLPEETVETPVEIRGPGETPEQDKEKDEKPAVPPGR